MSALLPTASLSEPDPLTRREYPQIIKYMGSKARIIDFVVEGINEARSVGPVCDLFAGACNLSGAIGHLTTVVTNDIQNYSKVIAHAYLYRLSDQAVAIMGNIVARASELVASKAKFLPRTIRHAPVNSLVEFNRIEVESRSLINTQFSDDYHLFLKNYSGTWWSAEQCAWIDALRQVTDEMLEANQILDGDHAIFSACVMHAMAYCGQGTGHYAQYRDANTESSMIDINTYRQKSIPFYFERKLVSLAKWNRENVVANEAHQYLSDDYKDCLKQLRKSTVYADPPYAFVHYSRFYHAIETYTLYDYPTLQVKGGKIVKGRYREDRHQSPFSIRSQVAGAFEAMFRGVAETESNLVLSYSNTALLDLREMIEVAHETFGKRYFIEALTTDHQHMTMGRRADRLRDVKEALLIARRC